MKIYIYNFTIYTVVLSRKRGGYYGYLYSQFFGYREISHPFLISERLEKVVREIIIKKEYKEFLVGRGGEFDQLASFVIRRVEKEYNYGNSALVLVLRT
ncbi:MAG: hypothetical protein ACI4UK_05125 [Floccifex sp.]